MIAKADHGGMPRWIDPRQQPCRPPGTGDKQAAPTGPGRLSHERQLMPSRASHRA